MVMIHKPDIFLLQETKMNFWQRRSPDKLKYGKLMGFSFVPSDGRSSGLAVMWDENRFIVNEMCKGKLSYS